MSVPLRTLGRLLLLACAALGVVAVGTVLIAFPGGVPTSSDPGAPAVPVLVTVLPAVVGIGLALALPWRRETLPVVVDRPRRLGITTGVLVALAVLFPITAAVVGPASEGYVLAKFVMFLVLPALLVLTVRRSIRIDATPAGWRWWAPITVVAVWALLSQAAPWVPPTDLSGIDPTALIIAATATAITAGVGEELFYRRWLQSRLEAGLGPWPGIALTALAFALMHLASHGAGDPLLDIARVIVVQGSFGLFVGVLWWRYRNLVMIVVAHLIVNGWPVVVHLITG